MISLFYKPFCHLTSDLSLKVTDFFWKKSFFYGSLSILATPLILSRHFISTTSILYSSSPLTHDFLLQSSQLVPPLIYGTRFPHQNVHSCACTSFSSLTITYSQFTSTCGPPSLLELLSSYSSNLYELTIQLNLCLVCNPFHSGNSYPGNWYVQH